MAVEDGAILGTLLSLYQEAHSQHAPHPTLPETLKLYESIQKLRTTTLHLGSISNRHYYQLEDGPEQEARDRKLKRVEWKELPEGESEDFIWIDVKYQKAVVCRDAIGDAKKKWEEIMEDAIRARGASDCPAATLSGWY
jgi:salicylate hydroxylase